MTIDKLENKLDSSAAWMLLTRASVKALGLISSLILVRILEPSDFGVVAVAMSVYAFIELFGLFGFNAALIQKTTPSKGDYDATFTINLLFGAIAALTLVISSSLLSEFFRDSRLENVFYFLSFLFFIQGFQNIKVVDFQKNMDFKKELKLQVIPKLFSFFLTLFLAWKLKSYWALIYGMLAHALFNIIYSYYVLPYKPSFSLKGGGELFKFSKWLMLNNFFYYLNNKSIDLIVGRMLSTKAVGFYSISQEMAAIPLTEIAAPINKASFPAYSKSKDNIDHLMKLYYRTITLITLLALPASAGLFVIADIFVPVVLGEKWLLTVDIIRYLAIASFLSAISTNNGYIFMALGKPYIGSALSFIRFLILFILFYLIINPSNISSPAIAIMFSSFINLFVSFGVLKILVKFSGRKLLKAVYKPIIGSIVMVSVVFYMKHYFVDITLINFFVLVFLGFITYITSIYFLWFFFGETESVETVIINKCKLLFNKKKNR